MLVSLGSSLGGARPKANVKDVSGELWVAKFPSKNGDYDVGAWEYLANRLAALCGLNLVSAKIAKYSSMARLSSSNVLTAKVIKESISPRP